MKLSPPASSSDLELAREIARRLSRQRRRADHSAHVDEEPPAPPRRLSPPPLPPRPAALRHEPLEPPAVLDHEPPPPPRAEVSRHAPAPRPDPVPRLEPPPARAALPPPEPEPPEPEPEATFALPEQPSWNPELSPELAAAAEEAEVEVAEPEDEEPLGALAAAPEPEPAVFRRPVESHAFAEEEPSVDVDVDDAAISPEQMVGGAADEVSPLDELTDPESSPFDDSLLDAPAAADEPAGPSWDDIVETCRGTAQAAGAMLVDPAGQVFAARGDWPAPGPNAIATKLVSVMEKTLKAAPTRAISAPHMGMHLTAWRVPLQEGLVTVVFIGKVPVRADARPAIDGEIHRGTGA